MDEDILISEESNITEEINFIETDAEVILNDLIDSFETFSGERLYDGDERKIFLEGFAYVLTDIMVHINEVGRENLLMYANNNTLDALGELYGNSRLGAKSSTVTLKFTLSTIPSEDIIISKGTRVTSDGNIVFSTDKDIIFIAKDDVLSKEVTATSSELGSQYNNIKIGELNKLIDGNAYVAKVENTTISGGGSDVETDEEYRERLKLSPFSFSVAGPANAYKMIALSVSNDVSDVSVYSPSAGVVEIAVLKNGGAIPGEDDEILDEILEACSDENRRPLTDKVQVVPVKGIDFNVNVKYYVSNNDLSKVEDIKNSVNEYIAWQIEKIGRDINPDKLNSMMFEMGAARVEITSPTFVSLKNNEVAKLGTVNVTYGGSISM